MIVNIMLPGEPRIKSVELFEESPLVGDIVYHRGEYWEVTRRVWFSKERDKSRLYLYVEVPRQAQ